MAGPRGKRSLREDAAAQVYDYLAARMNEDIPLFKIMEAKGLDRAYALATINLLRARGYNIEGRGLGVYRLSSWGEYRTPERVHGGTYQELGTDPKGRPLIRDKDGRTYVLTEVDFR